jgi:hypothetical protein
MTKWSLEELRAYISLSYPDWAEPPELPPKEKGEKPYTAAEKRSKLQAFIFKLKGWDAWTLYMFRLTAAAAYGSFVRRSALSEVKYKGTSEGTPSPDSDFTFGEDGSVQQYVTLKANFEKNQKNQTITTVRYFGDKNCVGFPMASICKEALANLKLSDGPLLRDKPSSAKPATPVYWDKFLCFFCAVVGLERSLYGMQSFRRGYAIALKDIGRLSDDEIQAIGYWWSGASRVYSGGARGMRLNLQMRPEDRTKYGDASKGRGK